MMNIYADTKKVVKLGGQCPRSPVDFKHFNSAFKHENATVHVKSHKQNNDNH